MKRTLYWMTKDLRINDNAAFNLANQAETLLCVFVVDKQWFEASNFQSKHLGNARWKFLQGCLDDLDQQLKALGQQLYIVYGNSLTTLCQLCDKYQITDFITTRLPGTYENRLISQFREKHPQISVNLVEQFTLFCEKSLPFELENLPESYSKFRKILPETSSIDLQPVIEFLPNKFESLPEMSNFKPSWLPVIAFNNKQGAKFNGGEQSGLKHLQQYFASTLPSNYKQVRNSLAGWENSSKLSAWLSYGCISARQVVNYIKQYELLSGKNSSTECLYLEILWREYFQWLHFKVGTKIYQFKGISEQKPLTTYYAERFNKWCFSNTPSSLINACMNELRLTGYLSNRGRQIVASYLVNELGIDWRYGAAWFEERLIDYDAAVNWGNWQYIAGVGADPRGGRHFNIEKQSEIFDPDRVYQTAWTENIETSRCQTLDSVDASDWPIQAKHNNGN
ncbi:DASH family cryptochrome [Colwellia polaris]|jgi:deoxyribodipyrimidine photo-lyase|uniref:DASH family cryptochrome n=1 Tax=Colwellia polaris TaxID=326537 RepID=UPI000A174125|nr:DASH family cryptochrome [Colwellia polaris]